MFDRSQDCTSIEQDLLTRLIAAALVTETVAWFEAESHAEHEVASLWGRRALAEKGRPVEVTNRVLMHLAAAADTAVCARRDSDWTVQVGRDVVEIRKLIGSAAG